MTKRFEQLVDETLSIGIDRVVPREGLIAKLQTSEETGRPLPVSYTHLTLPTN